jgi:regulator of replication initiation timing
MDFESLSQIEKQIELLASKSHRLNDQNRTLRNELNRMTLEIEHLRDRGQRLEIEKTELKNNSANPEQTQMLRKRIEALLKQMERHKTG